MTLDRFSNDEYDEYITRFHLADGEDVDQRRKSKTSHKTKKSDNRIIATLADEVSGLEGGFKISYKPARFEEGFLLSSLQPFYDQTLISDVLMRVKGGKEANVYLCQADPATGLDLLAAKVYRPRSMRNLRNDALYREGRELAVSASGVNRRKDDRMQRALKKKSAFGVQIAHSSWILHEYGALDQLYRLGAAVPKPYATGENAIILGYVGEAGRAAPTLHEVTLETRELQPLFQEVMRNIELMVKSRMIHGDLSAYNILYWQGKITVIDFPQVANAVNNRSAYFILQRDIQRVCEYFARQGLTRDPVELTDKLWWQHVGLDPVRQPPEEDLL
ncbi:MAG: hypothetical protein NT075_29485 [Chloroflexi bacterium]|nr:hypothetical protein [Chloroflexota bacterium]